MSSRGVASEAVEYRKIRVKRALSRSGLPDLDYALNPYVGCFHSCIYCYGRHYTRYEEVRRRWGSFVLIKENIVEVLKKEVLRLRKGVVGVATITDPYQPIEASEELSRASIDALLKSGFKVDVQTKSPMVVRDIDIFSSNRERVEVGITITTMNDHVASIVEPNAPPPSRRADALRELHRSRIKTWVFLGPIIPGVNDDVSTISDVVDVAAETASLLIYDWLRVKEGVKESLAKGLTSIMGEPSIPIATPKWRRLVAAEIKEVCSKKGVKCVPYY